MSQIQYSGESQTTGLCLLTSTAKAPSTGVGDCEDFALAKYLVLLDARFPDKDLRLLLVRDTFVKADHAVLAARHDHKWLILDNRWDRLYEDKDLKHFKPLMVFDAQGVYYLSKMFRIADAYDP
ncbi:MAG TPA: transglutaminase-like cysteine peptidase [Candidatus Binatia bacterium]|nr:transglutaminase-like cysteine peptidase [Candidatus Binatia bacterium]